MQRKSHCDLSGIFPYFLWHFKRTKPVLFASGRSRHWPERGTTMCQILIAPDRLKHSPALPFRWISGRPSWPPPGPSGAFAKMPHWRPNPLRKNSRTIVECTFFSVFFRFRFDFPRNDDILTAHTWCGVLAQLARAPRWQRGGHEFESHILHQHLSAHPLRVRFLFSRNPLSIALYSSGFAKIFILFSRPPKKSLFALKSSKTVPLFLRFLRFSAVGGPWPPPRWKCKTSRIRRQKNGSPDTCHGENKLKKLCERLMRR